MYQKRLQEEYIRTLSQYFKIVFLLGARQVGKSTLYAHLFPEVKTIVFDPLQNIYNARTDPDLFLTNFGSPLILDEIQYAPELLPSLKRKVDLSSLMGQYFLTGSQQISIMKNVSESLAGRVALVEIWPFIPQEQYTTLTPEHNWLAAYLNDPHHIQQAIKGVQPFEHSLYTMMWRGGMPGTLTLPQEIFPTYYSSYMQTYVERDVRILENIQDLAEFGRFVSVLAALTAQEINYSQLGREIELSPSTAQRWVQLLINTYQWRSIQPYHGNTIKRIASKPKGYVADTGMACYLQRISSPEALANHPLRGALFETFCFSLISALSSTLSTKPSIYHWRTSAGAEVDLVLELDGKLFPIEIKCKSNVTGHDTRGIQAFKETYPNAQVMPGLIVYAGTECYQINKDAIALPWNSIVKER